ncbi:MAG: ComF family protein [Thermodesulfobacteriota bacterium]
MKNETFGGDCDLAADSPRGARAILIRLASFLGRRCQACGAATRGGDPRGPASGRLLCGPCRERLAPRRAGFCPACGLAYADVAAEPYLCGPCRSAPPPWRNFAWHGPYEGLLGELVRDFKFSRRLGLARLLGALALEAWDRAAPAGPAPDLAVPVPLHPRRLAERGYNQSLLLARGLARSRGLTLDPAALARTRDTEPQARLAGTARRENIRGAFAADPDRVAGRGALLVDDVMTTGGTLEEASLALLRAGARSVDVLVLARTPRE